MRILVCGGRRFAYVEVTGRGNRKWVRDIEATNKAIDVVKSYNPTALIQGGATGADEIAEFVSHMMSLPMEVYRADWGNMGRAAGPIRNQKMLDEGKPDLVIAFPGGDGTADMVKKAKKANVNVVEIE